MSDSSALAPLGGDVVVRRAASPEEQYVLGRHQRGEQFSFRTYDEAVGIARGFAEKERVDVWYAAEAGSLVRIATFRSAKPQVS